ncbi:MAG: GGDEF domain-containing protein [Acidobacteriota bacterium]|jgi:diguanylate cyclase (GGDEF)-like protein|nr:GGDEF domain-containing protein [Acidobacteriota bacterium]
MLSVNLFVVGSCSKTKYSRHRTWGGTGGLGCAYMALVWFFDQAFPGFATGANLLLTSACLLPFLLPLRFLYKTTSAKIISIACLSWVYTFILLSLGMSASRMTGTASAASVILAVQTMLYAITLPSFYRMMKNKYLIMFRQLPQKQVVTLMWLGILWFCTVFAVNLGFAYPGVRTYSALSMVMATACAWTSYRYIYHLMGNVRSAKALEQVVHTDPLTQLKNRVVFSYDAKGLLRRNVPFRLVFLDLNNFKAINDRYGHLVGDQYLTFFAQTLKERIGRGNELYRLSGDEFLCVYTGEDVQQLVDAVTSLPRVLPLPGGETPFLGVSYGMVSFPDDASSLDDLLRLADRQMYVMKDRKSVTAAQ